MKLILLWAVVIPFLLASLVVVRVVHATPAVQADLNHNGQVTFADLLLFANAYNTTPESPNWNPEADFDGNGVVGFSDQLFLANVYNQYTHVVVPNGTALKLDGQPYTIIGVNRFNLLTHVPTWVCGDAFDAASLDTWFSEVQAMKANAVRFWAFQKFTAYGTDFAQFDLLVAKANQYNIKLIPVIENRGGDCGGGDIDKLDTWYAGGYLSPYGTNPMSLLAYMNILVTRYRYEPAILLWQIGNEFDNKNAQGNCAAFASFDAFAGASSDYVRGLDKHHLISFGTIGSGQCGMQTQAQYQQLHSHPNVNILEAHDYTSVAVPGFITADLETATTFNKPFFVGEGGLQNSCCGGLQGRADLFGQKITQQRAAGSDGYLIWIYRNPLQNTGDPYLFLFNDPIVAMLQGLAP